MGRRPDQERIDSLTEARTQLVHERTPKSREWRERSLASLPLGVASSFQDAPPYPIFFERAKGSRVWDVDGNEYADYHNGFGVMAVGHAHPKIVEALSERAAIGTHFAQPVAETTLLAEELCKRFRIDQMRFTNSGTEATMDAIRLARGVTGRDKIVKIEGSYHGHHESVLVSIRPSRDKMGPREHPASVEFGSGTPRAVTELTLIVPFNDAEDLDRLLTANAGEVAALIMEPVMMNVGIIDPEPGYLDAVREICSRHGVILIFDEVKTGPRSPTAAPRRSTGSPRPQVLRQGGRRRHPPWRVRRPGRADGRDRQGRRAPARHLQRQSAVRPAGLVALTEVLPGTPTRS